MPSDLAYHSVIIGPAHPSPSGGEQQRDRHWELERSLPDFALALALTREPAMRSSDFSRRIDAPMVGDVAARLPVSPGCAFVCGANAFVDIAADAALALGLEAGAIKTEC